MFDIFSGSGTDYSKEAKFTETFAKKIYYGPIYLRRESERLAGTRPDAGVSVVELNLNLVLEIVQQTKIGVRGVAYVVNRPPNVRSWPERSPRQAHTSNIEPMSSPAILRQSSTPSG
jgi:hypothetical protein